ncbi:MAG: flagellar export chaperone FliS [Terriglobales bacterium]
MRETARDHYRRMAVESATPTGLIGLLYEGAVTSLRRAAEAAESQQIARRVEHANRALGIIAHLRSSLDLARGGAVAATLERFYALVSAKIFEAGLKNSPACFADLASQLAGVREAWRSVERDEARGFPPGGATTAAVSRTPVRLRAGAARTSV